MRAAIYVRVSTDRQVEGVSLELQEKLCIKRAKELGYNEGSYDIFREDGYSGEDIEIRPKMSELRELVAKKVYKHVICYHPDRFSRDMTDKLIVCREFEKHGVELVFSDVEYENSPEGKLFFNIMSAIAEYEHALIKKRTVSGRIGRVKNHKDIMPMRVPPFGYDWKDKQLIINEEEAKYVRQIYKWYVYERLTLREIGQRLLNYGVTPKRKESKYWNATSISRILTSEIYIGNYYYNRRKTKKIRGEVTKSGNPKKTYDIRDKEDWIHVQVPAIVDENLWHLAQQQRKKNKTFSGNVKNKYLLRSLLVCKNCGRKWEGTFYSGTLKDGTKKKYFVYRCPNKNPKKYGNEEMYCDCKRNTISAEILEKFIWENVVLEIIKNPKELQEMIDDQNNEDNGLEREIDTLKYSLNKKKEEKDRIKKMFRMGVIDENEMLQDMKEVNKELEDIEYEISLLEAKQNAKMDSSLKKDIVMKAIKQYQEIIENNDQVDFETKHNLITLLIDEIEIAIDENNEVDLNIKGKIGGNLTESEEEMNDSNMELSTHRVDDMNTNQCLKMLIKSRFVVELLLNEYNKYTYSLDESSIKNNLFIK